MAVKGLANHKTIHHLTYHDFVKGEGVESFSKYFRYRDIEVVREYDTGFTTRNNWHTTGCAH